MSPVKIALHCFLIPLAKLEAYPDCGGNADKRKRANGSNVVSSHHFTLPSPINHTTRRLSPRT